MRRAFGFFTSLILLAPVPEETSGGGASDSGGGSGKPSGSDQPSGVTEDRVNEIVTKAVKRQIGDFAKQQATAQETFATTLTERLLGSLDEKLSAFKPAEPTPSGKKDPPAESSAELKQLRKELDETKKQLKLAADAEVNEKANARAATFRSDVETELAKHGSNAAKHARAALAEDGRIKYASDDSNEIVFVDDDGDEVPLNKGVPGWLKSADGKRFMPPSGASGSGARPDRGSGTQKSGNSGNGAASKSDLGQALGTLLDVPVI